MNRKRFFPLALRIHRLALLFLFVLLLSGCEKKKVELPLQTVLAEEVTQKTEPVYSESIGTLDGSVNASIRAQVGGYLIKQDYQEGSFVKAGTVLFEIDPRNYQAALDLAKKTLADKQARQLDTAAAQAAVDNAQLNLGYTQIKSAIDGVAGIAEAQVGDLIGQNSEMTRVSTIDPIKVSFNGSEQQAEKSLAKKNAILQLFLSDGTPYDQKGTLDIVNRQINQQTGTIQLVGLFPNPNGILRPGGFVRVRMTGAQKLDAILVPQRAVMQLQTIYVMAVVTPDRNDPKTGTISMRTVQVGNRIGNRWAIADGIQSGKKIVVEGVDKVQDGQKVNIEPYVDPDAPPPAQSNQAPAPAQ